MKELTILFSLAAAFLGSQATAAIADDVPTLDVSATCRAESSTSAASGQQAGVNACLADEQRAREQLTKEWPQYAADIKGGCARTEMGTPGIQSYVELLTCIQVARDAKNLPKQ